MSARRQQSLKICVDHPDSVETGEDGLPRLAYTVREAPVSTALRSALAELDPPPLEPVSDLPKRLTRWIKGCDEDALRRLGFDKTMPPRGAHMIARGTGVPFDLRNADILVESLQEAGLAFESGKRYLDFGCSSGRTVRTLALAYPAAEWQGCDPVPSSIKFARERYPGIAFSVTRQEPPTGYKDGWFDGVYAKSIWTHFSAAAGIRWMREMARIVRPGGFVAVTVHGVHDLARRFAYADPEPKYHGLGGFKGFSPEQALQCFLADLQSDGFAFRPYNDVRKQGDLSLIEGAKIADWGITFMTGDWAAEHLAVGGLRMHAHLIGRTGNRHDLLVFKKLD